MVSCANVWLFIWRRLLLQTLWRHYATLAVELTFVVVTFVYLLSHDRVDPAQVKKLNRSYIIPQEPTAADAEHIRHKLPPGLIVVYGPATADTDRLIAAVFNAAGRESPTEQEDDIEQMPSDEEGVPKDYILPLQKASSVPAKCRAVASRLLRSDTYARTVDRTMCVQFYDPDNEQSLRYNLIELLPPEVILPEGVLYSLEELFANPSITAGGDVLAKIADTIQVQQTLIDHAHMVLQGGFTNSTELFAGHIPMEAPFEDIHNYRNGLFAAVTIGFCLPLVLRVRDITREIGSGLKDVQEVMGLSSNEFWVGHFFSALPISMVEGALAAAVLILHEERYKPSRNVTVYKGDNLEVSLASSNSTTAAPPTPPEHGQQKFIRVYTHVPRVTRYLENADGSLVAATFAIFAFCHTLLALLIACVFPFGRWAMVIGFAVYFMLPSVDGDKLGLVFGNSLFAYLTGSRNEKLRTAFYPSVALSNAMKIIGIFDDFEKAAYWNILPKPALNLDTVALKDMWAMMATTAVAFILLIAYLSEVLPWTATRPKPLHFFLKPKYWFPAEPRVAESEPSIKSPESEDRFESPPELRVALECQNLVKVFDGVVALNKVNMSIYGSQVTVLLGHNGAGKTTLMSILTGLIKADSGTVFLHEREITTYSTRGILGFCPQTDVFFDDLTVLDHLQYFGMLKGLMSSQINRYVKMLLETVQLSDKLYAYPGELSGGMKRKLSIAIALITRPKVLILDEPTVGMDPETRRVIWTLVQGMRGRTTLVLSTHDMEEADTLADRIIVMYNGNVICAGSPSFLKNASGVGYKLRIAKGPGAFRGNDILVVTRKSVPRATVEHDGDTEMVIGLNTLKRNGFEAMFLELENKSAALGIQSIGVTVATMKDAYIRIYNLWAEGPKDQAYESESRQLSETSMLSPPVTRREPRMWQRFRALMQKRLLYQWRTPFLFFTGWILPVFIAFSALGMVKLKTFQLPVQYRHIDLDAAAFVGDKQRPFRTFIQKHTETEAYLNYKVLLESANVPHFPLSDALRRLLILFDKKFFKYVTYYAFGCVFRHTVIEMWSNPLSVIAASIQRNLVDTALLRQQTGQPNSHIRTGVSLYALTEEEIHADVRQRDPLSDLKSLLAHTWAYWGAMASVSFGLIMSSFVVLPSLEVCSEARHLQLMTGMPGLLYLGTHFLFDLAFYLVPMAIIYGGFAAIFEVPTDTLVSLIIIVLAFAPVGILLPYFVSEHTSDGGTAYAVILGLFAIAGPGSIIGFLLAADAFHGQNFRMPFMFFPPFALPATTVRAINLKYEVAICDYLRSKKTLREKHIDFCNSVKAYGSTINLCCNILTNRTRKAWYEIKALSTSPHGIVPDILIMLTLGALLFAYLAFRVSGRPLFRRPKTCPPQRPPNKQDADVAAERAVVDLICRQRRFGQRTMVAQNLHKMFRQVHAVRGLSFTVRPAECFGLLGVNGAGKTTTFRMLAALTRPTYGDAYMRDAVLSEEPRWWQSKIGYCPEDGALLEKLSAYEMLFLFGRLRGVPEEDLAAAVDRIIGATDLRKHASKRCQVYSVGSKRKLSTAVALIGSPAVVFLDEPYAGVDVLARARIHDGLASLKESTDSTIVLTSHSMEECELSCDRMCIMVDGELVCMGTLQHLKDKFGRGYKLLFTLTDDTRTAVEQLTRAVRSTLPGITVIDVRRRVVEFRMETKLPWSTLFQKLAALEKDFAFEHLFVSDNTLEQIFIEFARKAHEEKPKEARKETDTTREPPPQLRAQ